MGSYNQSQEGMAEVAEMNRIAEACAELALYRVMISIDYLLDHYTTGPALAAMETELWIFTEFAGIRGLHERSKQKS
jgi:hypothetical protein